jgi:hypothetical protein
MGVPPWSPVIPPGSHFSRSRGTSRQYAESSQAAQLSCDTPQRTHHRPGTHLPIRTFFFLEALAYSTADVLLILSSVHVTPFVRRILLSSAFGG